MKAVGKNGAEYSFIQLELSPWVCYMFGNTPGGGGLVYRPPKGKEPNLFVRWMMKVCFACTWIKEE